MPSKPSVKQPSTWERSDGSEARLTDGQPRFTIVTERDEYPSRSVLIAGGIAPSRLEAVLKDADRWYGRLQHRILDPRCSPEGVLLVAAGFGIRLGVNLQGIARFI